MCLFCLCVLVLITWRTLYYFSCLHEDLLVSPISSQNAVKMKCWPDLIYYFLCALPECQFTTPRQLLVLLVYIYADYMKNLWISLTTWRLQWSSNSKPDRDGGDMLTQPCLLLSCALPELLELSGLTLTTWAQLRTDLNIIVRWRQASHQRKNILPECTMYALPVLYQLTYYAPCCTNCQVSCLTMWSLSAWTVATAITLSRTTTALIINF